MRHILGCDFWCSSLQTASCVRFNCMPLHKIPLCIQQPFLMSVIWLIIFCSTWYCRSSHWENEWCIILALWGSFLHMLKIAFNSYSIFNVLVPGWIARDRWRLEFERKARKSDFNWLSPVGDVQYFEHHTVCQQMVMLLAKGLNFANLMVH
jgi:hypothetical protein